MQNNFLIKPEFSTFESKLSPRPGETKVGEVLMRTSISEQTDQSKRLNDAANQGVRYAIVLVPEDIGPRGNLGRKGADKAPDAFMQVFLNMQSNHYFDYSKVMIAGEVDIADLQKSSQNCSVEKLRNLVEELDKRVKDSVESIVAEGIKPIVLGGGNNNSYPTIQGVTEAGSIEDGINCINCDPHADYRALEGRHSGNPFSYAHKEGLLDRYCVFGLHESYNSEEMLNRLSADGFKCISFDNLVSGEEKFEEQLKKAVDYFSGSNKGIGVELDLDSIKYMPSSALTPIGLTEEQGLQFVHKMTSSLKTLYLHLSEGSPECTTDDGARKVGKFMAYAVNTYLKADS